MHGEDAGRADPDRVLLIFAFPRPACPGSVCVVRMDNRIINPVTAGFIIDAIADAETAPYDCVVIELDTLGGLLESTRDVVLKELNAKVPVVVYIAPRDERAASAGVFITMAGDVAAMAPGTNIGASSRPSAGLLDAMGAAAIRPGLVTRSARRAPAEGRPSPGADNPPSSPPVGAGEA